MSYADVMTYAVQLDTWKQTFDEIINYSKLENPIGYKVTVRNNLCYLDPPSIWQHISRWYHGYSKEQFLWFLEDHKPKFIQFLNDVKNSNVINGRTHPARSFINSMVLFLTEFARACSVCRGIYPEYDKLNSLLLTYYHGIREWIASIGY